jgi:DNA (cytosine-5)-methyltransferase 1
MQKNKPHRIIGPWNLTDVADIQPNGLKVFSCFHCGGGSTMGYKLAGFNVLGGIEIDPKMMEIYRINHNPKHSYLMGIQEFKDIPNIELPPELLDLDILDGSPPCSSFSMSGSREKKWGSEHHFREGQAVQRLDDLFFDFIDVTVKLKPKIVIAENVKGLIMGNARGYVKQIFAGFKAAGYTTKLFLLNASAMGVPQRRERTIFVAVRNDIERHVLFDFSEKQISLKTALLDCDATKFIKITKVTFALWEKCQQGNSLSTVHKKKYRWNWSRENWLKPCRTFVSTAHNMILHPIYPRPFSDAEKIRIQSFPDDYKFGKMGPGYICGMSVPPFMMQRIALEVGKQIFGIEYDMQIVNNFTGQQAKLEESGETFSPLLADAS